MDTPNPNVCPTCGSRNTGATFGWKPQRVNEKDRKSTRLNSSH